jgi:hypothetical protein
MLMPCRSAMHTNTANTERPESGPERPESGPERPECEPELQEEPSQGLILELKIARIKKEAVDVAEMLKGAPDPSVEQKAGIQDTIDILQAIQCNGLEPTTTTVAETAATKPTRQRIPHVQYQQSPFLEHPRCSSSIFAAWEPSPAETLRRLEAQVVQQKMYNAMAWGAARNQMNIFVRV